MYWKLKIMQIWLKGCWSHPDFNFCICPLVWREASHWLATSHGTKPSNETPHATRGPMKQLQLTPSLKPSRPVLGQIYGIIRARGGISDHPTISSFLWLFRMLHSMYPTKSKLRNANVDHAELIMLEKSIAPKYVGAVKPSMAIATKLTKRSLPMGKKSSLNPTKRPVKYQDYQWRRQQWAFLSTDH